VPPYNALQLTANSLRALLTTDAKRYAPQGIILNKNIFISLIFSAGLGAVIWAMSPVVVGAVEPWDSESPYYFVSLFIAGGLVGIYQPGNIWAIFIGIVIGQFIYMVIFLPVGPLIVIGMMFLFGYSLLSLFGAFLASRIRGVPKSGSPGDENGA